MAIGIHAGPAIVGTMGYGGTLGVTAIGDTVNVASRLEAAAKEFDAAIVISEDAARLSGVDLTHFEAREIAIRGSARPVNVRIVPQGSELDSAARRRGVTSGQDKQGRRRPFVGDQAVDQAPRHRGENARQLAFAHGERDDQRAFARRHAARRRRARW